MVPADMNMPWGIAVEALLALAIFAIFVGAVSSNLRERAGGYWILGWAALILTGALYLAESSGFAMAGRMAFVSNAMFAPMMLMGALELRDPQSRPSWPIYFGLAAGGVRIALAEAGFETALLVHGLIIAPAFLAAASWTMLQAPPQSDFRVPIAVLLAAFVGCELLDAYQDWAAGRNRVPWGQLLLVVVPLAALQVSSRLTAMRRGIDTARAAGARAEEERDLQRWRFEVLFDHAHELVAELDQDTRILFVNSRVTSMLGLDPAKLIGTRAFDYLPPESLPLARESWRNQVLSGGLEDPIIFPMPHQNGETVYLEISVSDYGFPDEMRLLVIARDVTSRLRTQSALRAEVQDSAERLRASQSKLRDQERLAAVGTLASGIAHQINNPIGAISAAAEFALATRHDANASEIYEESMTRILDEAQRAGRIVKSVLRFARHGSATKWVEDIGAVVRRAAEIARPYVVERGGALEMELLGGECLVEMSPIEIEQAIVNLIRNASESSSSGANVALSAQVLEDRAVIEIRDDGRGISPEAKPRLFDPFYTTRLREGGSGLGLSVVHGVVMDHGGEVEVESEQGQGTTVRLRFPIAPKSDPAPA